MDIRFIRWIKNMMKVGILALLIASIGLSQPFSAFAKEDENVINWLESKKILNSNFQVKKIRENPQAIITRQEFVALLMSSADVFGRKDDVAQLVYADKEKINKKFRNYLGAAYVLGVLPEANSNGKTYLRPEKGLTRQMAAFYLGRCLNMDIDLTMPRFLDYDKIYSSCQPYVTALVSAGLQKGATYSKFKPTQKVTWNMAGELIRAAYEAGYFTTASVDVLSRTKDKKAGKQEETLLYAEGIAFDDERGIIYIADTRHNQIKAIEEGKLRVVAGKLLGVNEKGLCIGGYADGRLDQALFNQPSAVAVVQGGLLVADMGNHVIRYINLEKETVSTYAGTGKAGSTNGNKGMASFQLPQDLAIATDGTIYVADTGNHCIRKISTSGEVSIFAGTVQKAGYLNGAADSALFNEPTGIAVTEKEVYVADCGNQRIRKISDGTVSTIAGVQTEKDENSGEYLGGFYNGSVLEALFNQPKKLTVTEDGTIYVSESGNGILRKIKDGMVTTAAGFGATVSEEGFRWKTYLSKPSGLAFDAKENRLLVLDTFLNHVIGITMK